MLNAQFSMLNSQYSILQLRHARRMAYLNGMIWSFGNGLVSTMLVVYLAMDLGLEVVGLGVSLILAAPHVVGLLRMGAPAMIRRLGDRKTFCLATFALSALTLLALPLTAAGRLLPSARASLYALVAAVPILILLVAAPGKPEITQAGSRPGNGIGKQPAQMPTLSDFCQ
jgi:hypothetical protein